MTDSTLDFIVHPRMASHYSEASDQAEIAREKAAKKRLAAKAAAKEATEQN